MITYFGLSFFGGSVQIFFAKDELSETFFSGTVIDFSVDYSTAENRKDILNIFRKV